VVQKYYKEGQVTTFFNRIIDSDDHHALNYIIQSTAADLFLRQMIKVWEYLKDKKSNIAFCLHDSLVIDLHHDDQNIIQEIKELFADTELGCFKVNVSHGKNFGEMVESKT
jgi:DNA polymerase I-like protein with 3'-5' exonuclease and polymerase domains